MKTNLGKKLLSMMLVLTMIASMFTFASMTVSAANAVSGAVGTSSSGTTATSDVFGTFNGITASATHRGLTGTNCVLEYALSGKATVSGSYKVWFESTDTGITQVDKDAQTIRTYHFYAGDLVNCGGYWLITKPANPSGVVLKMEYSGDPSIGGTQSFAGITATTSGVLISGSGADIYQVSIDLKGTAAASGNWKVDVSGLPAGYTSDIETKVFHFAAGEAVSRTVKYQIKNPNGSIDLNALSNTATGLKLVYEYNPDTVFAPSTANGGVTASGNVRASYEAGMVNISVDVSGTGSTGGTYTVSVAGNQNLPSGVILDKRNFNLPAGAVSKTLKWSFDYNSLDVASLGLTLSLAFIPDTPFTSQAVNNVTASGIAKVLTDADVLDVAVTLKGTPSVSGNYTATITNNGVTIQEKRYYLNADVALANKEIKFQKPLSEINLSNLNLAVSILFETDKGISSGTVNGITASGVAKYVYDAGSVSIDLGLVGTAAESGSYRVYVASGPQGGSLNNKTEYRISHLNKGDDAVALTRAIKYSLDYAGFDINNFDMKVVLDFFPDITAENRGVTATGTVSMYEDECLVNVVLSGKVEQGASVGENNGYYRLSLLNGGDQNSPVFTYFEGSVVRDSYSYDIKFPSGSETDYYKVNLDLTFTSDSAYIYKINYWDETIVLGGMVNFGADVLYTLVKDPAKFAADKAKWYPTLNGRIDISKSIPKKADPKKPNGTSFVALKYVKTGELVYQTDNNGNTVYVDQKDAKGNVMKDADGNTIQVPAPLMIELTPRPDAAALKALSKTIYNTQKAQFENGTDVIDKKLGTIHVGSKPSDKIEIRLGADKGAQKGMLIEKLGLDESYKYDYDKFPFGSSGTIRIAANEDPIKEWVNGAPVYYTADELAALKIDSPETYAEIAPHFASAPVSFKVAAQPKAPATAKMAITAGKAGAPSIIKGTTAAMKIVLGTDKDGNLILSDPLGKDMTVRDFDKMLVSYTYQVDGDGKFVLDGNGNKIVDTTTTYPRISYAKDGNYVFEIRLFDPKNAKPLSAAAYLKLPVTQYDDCFTTTLTIADVSISGKPNDTDPKAVLAAKGVDVVLTLSNNALVPAIVKGAEVDWFTNLPAGLTASVKSISGAVITVTIKGVPTEEKNGTIAVTIPADSLKYADSVESGKVYEGVTAVNEKAVYNIAEPADTASA